MTRRSLVHHLPLTLVFRLLALTLGAAIASAALLLAPLGRPAELVESLRYAGADFQGGLVQNLLADGSGLALGPDPEFTTRLHGGRRFGLFTSGPRQAEGLFDWVAAHLDALQPADSAVEIELRVSGEGSAWSSWQPIAGDGSPRSFPEMARFVQYRLTLVAGPEGTEPLVRSVRLDLWQTGVAPALASSAQERPTVRLYATREGLVGQRTANGHLIEERDRFVALPSKRALNAEGRRDYQVTLSYKGRRVVAPVWDVGPWNTRDNFWDAEREMWADLPRFMPQVFAAFFNGYNTGRDERGRWVTYPVAIDLADGTFWDDLGMTTSDWVDVTFLWVDAPSPPPLPVPEKVTPKTRPAEGEVAQPPALGSLSERLSRGRRWYLAEGSTKEPFQSWILLLNPGDQPASVDLIYTVVGRDVQRQRVRVEPTRRVSIFANQVVDRGEFAVRIDADRAILAERAVYFRGDGVASAAVASPSTVWYLPEGSTQAPFETWFHVYNPGTNGARVTVRLFPERGREVAHSFELPATSRHSVRASELVPNAAFATRVDASTPVVVERATYLGADQGGSGGFGATAPAYEWYFAEGDTTAGRETWLLLQNPREAPATVKVRYLPERGQPLERVYGVNANARASVHVNRVLGPMRFGMHISSDVPIVAERSIYFGGADGRPAGAHASTGSPRLAGAWFLPEGATTDPFQTLVLVANPHAVPVSLRVDLMGEHGASWGTEYSLEPQSRFTLDLASIAPDAAVSARVSASRPVVVERTMYLHGGEGGTNAMGIPWDE